MTQPKWKRAGGKEEGHRAWGMKKEGARDNEKNQIKPDVARGKRKWEFHGGIKKGFGIDFASWKVQNFIT